MAAVWTAGAWSRCGRMARMNRRLITIRWATSAALSAKAPCASHLLIWLHKILIMWRLKIPDGSKVLVLMNNRDTARKVNVKVPEGIAELDIPAYSVMTFVW